MFKVMLNGPPRIGLGLFPRPNSKSFSTSLSLLNKKEHSHSHIDANGEASPCNHQSHSSHTQDIPDTPSSPDEHSHSHSVNPFTHTHSHSHTNELLTLNKSQFSNPGVRITWIGLIVNVGMAVTKGIGGAVFHSQALVADSLHSLSDLISDFLTLGTVNVASKNPSTNFPLGYGKIETLGSLGVSAILLFAGLSVGWESLVSILEFIIPHNVFETLSSINFGHSHSHSHSSHEHTDVVEKTDINAAWLALGSIFVKEWLFNRTLKIAKQTNSKVLVANAWHHRVDSLTSAVALATISGGYFLNITWLDSVGGLLVSMLIIKAGFDGLRTATLELVDKSTPPTDERYLEVQSKINDCLKNLISNNNSGVPYKIEDLVMLPSGANLNLNLKLAAPKQRWENVLTINEFENVSNYINVNLKKDDKYVKNVFVSFVEGKNTPDIQE